MTINKTRTAGVLTDLNKFFELLTRTNVSLAD